MLICRHGTAVWLVLSEPCDGEIHAEIPLDPLTSIAPATTGMSGSTGCPRSFVTATASTDRTDNGHRYDPAIILIDPAARALSCGRPWATGGSLPRRSLMTEIDDRPSARR